MARYSPDHKQATRRQMIKAASRRFNSDGIDGSGISTLVADAGLTNGAFYGHFSSKDDLVASVVAHQLAEQVAALDAMPVGATSVEQYLQKYLSPAHRDDRAGGCPSAALLAEIGRCDEATRRAYTDGARAMTAAIARHLDDGDAERTQRRASGLFTLAVSAIQLARAVTDPVMSEQILTAAHTNALTFVGTQPGPAPTSHQEQ